MVVKTNILFSVFKVLYDRFAELKGLDDKNALIAFADSIAILKVVAKWSQKKK